MKKILNYLANKAMCAAFVVLGAASASAELVKEPIMQTFEGEAESVSVGYTVTGLGEFKNEVAVVFTNHTKTATWTVPADLENVEFLVVGGGGGGGADSSATKGSKSTDASGHGQGGGGGGGGGVAAGFVKRLSVNDSVSVSVGVGGNGGVCGKDPDSSSSTDAVGAAPKGGASSTFSVNGNLYITAKSGGRDLGKNKSGGYGASNAGCRKNALNTTLPTTAEVSVYAKTLVADGVKLLGNNAGIGHATEKYRYAAGGGGGAGGDGFKYTTKETDGKYAYNGGNGGAGFESSITGVKLFYGAGGGGGTTDAYSYPGVGGIGGDQSAGSGSVEGDGGDAWANQGGGGGGGGEQGNGGNGGSGIVVFRYATNEGSVDFSSLASKIGSSVYTGENLVALSDTIAYSVSYGEYSPNAVGEYTVVVTLNDGFVWDDAVEEKSRELPIKFAIVKADDEWVAEPSITKTSWSVGDDAGELIAPTTKFNADLQVVISKKDDSAVTFSSLDNLDAGDYVVTWTALGTDNYNAAEGSKTVEFTVVASDAIPPYTLSLGEISVNDDRELSIPYSLSCEATTSKMAEIIAVYTIEGSGETNEVSLATQVALNGGDFTGIILDLKPGATYSVAIYSLVGDEKSELTEFKTVTVLGEPKNLTAEATFTTTPDKKFIVTGSVTPGIGETKVTLYYSLNSTECASTMEQVVNDDGAFAFEISYENLTDNLSWYVSAATTYDTGTWQGRLDGGNTTKVTTARKENAQSYYVWTGNGGDSLWTNPLNWTCSNNSCYGYPGVRGLYYFSWVGIETSPLAPIDLGGGVYDFIDNGAFVVGDGVIVEFYNGTLRVHGSKPMNEEDDYKIGRANSTMTFNEVNIDNLDILQPIAGSTIEFKGTTTQGWKYKPYTGSTSTKFVVRDGVLTTGYSVAQPGSGSEVLISNAVWVVTNAIYEKDKKRGLAKVTKFRDGADNQARLLVCKTLTDATDYALELYGTYDMKIPSNGVAKPYVVADYVSSVDNFDKFVIDVTDYAKGDLIPLIYQSGAGTGTNTRMETFITERTDALQLIANGEDVTSERNGRLVWDYEAKTLYFQQDIQAVAQVGDDKFTSLAEAIEYAGAGDTITLVKDIELKSYLEITKSITLDLNEKSIRRADGTGIYVNGADAQVVLTNGTIEASNIPVYVNQAKTVDIYDCVVKNTDSNEAVYVQTKGLVRIHSGRFSTENQYEGKYWVLNINDNNRDTAKIEVYGGTFVNFNPQNCNTEVEGYNNFCADGYAAVAGEVEGTWVVQKEISELEPGTPVTDISATSEEDAISKVELTVEVPAGANITKDDYAKYFKLVATETSVRVWKVEAVLNEDVVKPVIAETTADDTTKEAFVIDTDGNVTLNISNKKPGLYYGVQVLKELGADPEVTVSGLVVPAEEIPEGNAAFFRVVVDFKPIPEVE